MVLLTIFWDSEGVVHTEFLEQGNTVNSTKYVNTLEKLKARLRRVTSEKVSIIHHDNARPHTSLETRTALDRLGLRTLPHPPYSPILLRAISSFFQNSRITSRATVTGQTKMWRMLFFLGAETRLLTSSLTASNSRPSVASLYRTGRWLCWKMICHLVLNKMTFSFGVSIICLSSLFPKLRTWRQNLSICPRMIRLTRFKAFVRF